MDVAERRYVNNVNLTAQTPVITINGANTGRTAADRQNLANAIRDILIEQVSAGPPGPRRGRFENRKAAPCGTAFLTGLFQFGDFLAVQLQHCVVDFQFFL